MSRIFTFLFTVWSIGLMAQASIQIFPNQNHQIIDGFGAHQGSDVVNQSWWQELYFDDLGASIYRVDLTPRLISPYSDLSYYSPWFMGSGTDSVFNLEDPDNPNGPEDNRVRTYTGPDDYSRLFGGLHAPIAVMGPDIESNVDYFTYSPNGAIQAGKDRAEELGDFKLIGSLWSPVPWVKISSGNSWQQDWWPGPVMGSEWPFIWGGNFAGGMLDVSGNPLEVFDDSGQGGNGPTSSLTQFARSTAAYIKGYQEYHEVEFYAISLQNELNFEQFYNSTTYPLSSQYIAALKTLRNEFDQHPALENILIMGPEDLLGGDSYGMWQYGGAADPTHKNLQYLQNIASDAEAAEAIDFFCIHGYGSDGVTSAGATSTLWDWWVNGWTESPDPGIPGDVAGFASYGKKSWMTETSGEVQDWLSPNGGFPSDGGWSIGVKIHQALTTGQESAWIYWTFTEDDGNGNVTPYALSNQTQGNQSAKYVAAKHFFKFIRPGAYRVETTSTGNDEILASAYKHPETGDLTIVLINTSSSQQAADLQISDLAPADILVNSWLSENNSYWNASSVVLENGAANFQLPAYSIMTLQATAAFPSPITETLKQPLSLEVAPNPASNRLNIQIVPDETGEVQISLCDIRGQEQIRLDRKIQEGIRYTENIDTGGLMDGVYFLQVQNGRSIQAKKIIITH
ncbi:MAG: T9SS type A sorting domain-containing protein [Bacteroidetes bacterium]|nr:T9SS type A sorting domain-containing protein [Bacteroidota bacterium]